ncbi:MAG: histidine kinase, partial [Butyricicoccus sp.]
LPDDGQIICSEEYYIVFPVGEQPPWDSQEKPLTPLFFRSAIGRVSQQVYAYLAPVNNENGESLGTLCVTIDERQLYYALLAPLANAGREEYQILDPEGRVCSAESAAQLGSRPAGLNVLPANRIDVGSTQDGMLLLSVQAPFSGYRILCRSDRAELTRSIRDRQTLQALIMAAVFLILLLVAWLVSKWLYRPVEKLTAAIDQVSRGDFTAHVAPSQTDEFATLTEHFNDMVRRIDGLMHQVVREQTEKKQAELHALQYQIRPHFMYNTLNSIRFAATLQRNKTLADQLGAFINLLEASIQKKGAFLPLREEIELVESFVSLQKFRYSDCFAVEYQVSERAENCYVPCLLLQPVVENAIFHGIDTRRTDNRIILTATVQGDRLHLSLRDNGQGMDAETVQGLLAGDPTEDKRRLTGIGLRNIQERLRLYYGEKAWFHITSVPGEGTCAEFDLPVSQDPQEYRI